MKPHPLGIDNPIKIKQDWGSNRWALYWKEDFQRIATFPNQFVAYESRNAILRSLGFAS